MREKSLVIEQSIIQNMIWIPINVTSFWVTKISNLVRSDNSAQLRTTNVLSFLTEGSLVNKTDLLALYLSSTYCHKTGTRPLAVLLLDNRLYMLQYFHMKPVFRFALRKHASNICSTKIFIIQAINHSLFYYSSVSQLCNSEETLTNLKSLWILL